MQRFIVWSGFLAVNVVTAFLSVAYGQTAIFTDSDGSRSLSWHNHESTVVGDVHSNGDVLITGKKNSVEGQTTYVGEFFEVYAGSSQRNVFEVAPAQVAPRPWPLDVMLADFAPGGTYAQSSGAQYFDLTERCGRRGRVTVDLRGSNPQQGTYYANCSMRVVMDGTSGQFTFAAAGKIWIASKNHSNFEAYAGSIAAYSGSDSTQAIFLDRKGNAVTGSLVAPYGTIRIAGSLQTLKCGLFAKKVKISAFQSRIEGACPLLENSAPVAIDDLAETLIDTPIDIDVLANDTDADGSLDPASVTVVANGSGSTEVLLNGRIRFTPAPSFVGTTVFTYTVTDNDGAVSNVAEVRVEVSSLNQPPVAVSDLFTVDEDGAATIDVLANDFDGETTIDIGSFLIVDAPDNGELTLLEPMGTVRYTPNADFNGADQFAYTVSDDEGLVSEPGIVDVTINPINDAPQVSAALINVIEDTATSFTVDVVDPDDTEFTYIVTGGAQLGVLSGPWDALVYTPATDFTGTDTFEVTVSDGDATTAPVLLTFEVTPENDAPIVAPATVTVTEDTPTTVPLAITDPDSSVFTLNLIDGPTNGVLSGNVGSLIYTPHLNFVGLDRFLATISDGESDSAQFVVTLQVTPVNDAPVVSPATINIAEDTATPFSIEILDPDSSVFTYSITGDQRLGQISGAIDALVYTPPADFVGTDTFLISVNDGEASSAPALLTFIVGAANDAPVLRVSAVTTAEDTSAAVPLIIDDPDSDAFTLSVVGAPSNGVLTGGVTDLVYTPNTDFFGQDSFEILVNDGELDSAPVVVPVEVTPVNDAPAVTAGLVLATEDQPATVPLSIVDPDSDEFTITVIAAPTNGTLSGGADDLTYTPAADFFGDDTFEILVNDGSINSSPIVVNVSVAPVNDAPVVSPTSVNVTEDTPTPFVIGVTDPDSSSFTYTITGGQQQGQVTGSFDALVYTPPTDFVGADTFEITVSDGEVSSAPVIITFNVGAENDSPVLSAAPVTTAEDTAAAVPLTIEDPDSTTFVLSVVSAPVNGALSGGVDDLTYTPNTDFFGDDSFEIRVNDGTDDSAPVVVSVEVTPVNDAPVVVASPVAAIEDQSAPVTLNIEDPDSDAFTLTVVVPPANGSVAGGANDLVYTPDADYFGADSFQVLVNDGDADSSFITVEVQVASVNDTPVVDSAVVAVVEDTPTPFAVVVTDPDSTEFTYAIVGGSQQGQLTGTLSSLIYTPPQDFVGTDTFTITVSDGELTSAPAALTFNVGAENDAPVVSASPVTTAEDTAVAVPLTVDDPDSTTFTLSVVTLPTNGSLSGGVDDLTYTPNADFFGDDTFEISVNDGVTNSAPVVVSVDVTSVNDAPVVQPVTIAVIEDTATPFSVAVEDPDSTTFTYTVTGGLQQGELSGPWTALVYTPPANFFGVDTFELVVNDGEADSAPVLITFDVSAENDAPTVTAAPVVVAEDDAALVALTIDDPDSTVFTLSVTSPASNGVVTGGVADLTYTPAADYFGTDAFEIVINDGAANSAPTLVTVEVTPVNDAPTAEDASFGVIVGQDTAIEFSGSDIDSTTLTVNIVSGPANGVLSGTGLNRTYTPNSDFPGTDTIAFSVSDGELSSNEATISLSGDPANNPPTITSTPITTTDTATTYQYQVTAEDLDNDTLTFSLDEAPATMTIVPSSGLIEWANPQAGSFDIVVRVTDTAAEFATQSFTLAVTDNTAPVFTQLPVAQAPLGRTYVSGGQVVDPDGDAVTVSLDASAPVGMELTEADDGRFLLTWTPSGPVGSAVSVPLIAEDSNGAQTLADVAITLTGNETDRTFEGTDFWFAMGSNFPIYNSTISGIPGLARDHPSRIWHAVIASRTAASGVVTVADVGFSQAFSVMPGESVVVDLPPDVQLALGGAIDPSIQVTSDAPITVTGFNWARASSAGFLVKPVQALGTDYLIAGYEWYQRGQAVVGTILAVEDNTTITVTEMPERSLRNDPTFATNTYTLQRGELQFIGSIAQSMLVTSDRPIALFSGSNCSFVPIEVGACDHLWEQIQPIPTLSNRYVAAPLQEREAGALYRIFATEDDTNVYINGGFYGTIDQGRLVEYFSGDSVVIEATRPVLAFQLATSVLYSSDRGTNSVGDPFMLQLTAPDTYLANYVFAVPDRSADYPDSNGVVEDRIPLNYGSVVIPTEALSSLRVNGASVTPLRSEVVPGTEFTALTIELPRGGNTASADVPFGLFVYGYSTGQEAYGFGVDRIYASPNASAVLEVTPLSQSVSLPAQACVEVLTRTLGSEALPFVPVSIAVSGVADDASVRLISDGTGRVEYCLDGRQPGTDTLIVTAGGDVETATINWVLPDVGSDTAPVFLSEPVIESYTQTYSYIVDVVDYDGDDVTITVESGPDGMFFDAVAGAVVWTPEIPEGRESVTNNIVLRATDTNGNRTEQPYRLTFHFPVEITPPLRLSSADVFGGRTDTSFRHEGGDQQLLRGRIAAGNASLVYNFGFQQWDLSVSPIDLNDIQGSPNFNFACVANGADIPSFTVEPIWQRPDLGAFAVVTGPVVDTDGSGVVDAADDIYAGYTSSGALTLVNLTQQQVVWSQSLDSIVFREAPAFANIDDDPELELLVSTRAPSVLGQTIQAFNPDGTVAWTPTATIALPGFSPGLQTPIVARDLDGDGRDEVLHGPTVLSSDGDLLWRFDIGTTNFTTTSENYPVTADIDGDGSIEVAFGQEVRNGNGTLRWTAEADGEPIGAITYLAFGDITDDPGVELVAAYGTADGPRVAAWSSDGTQLWPSVAIDRRSEIVLADVTLDGVLDISLPVSAALISSDGRLIDQGSALAGTRGLITDLNGDGRLEAITGSRVGLDFRELNTFGIRFSQGIDEADFRGGDVRAQHISVADVDHDGSSDLVVAWESFGVYSAVSRNFTAPTRNLWQRVPQYPLRSGVAQLPSLQSPDNQPDIALLDPRVDPSLAGSGFDVSVDVGNIGTRAITEDFFVDFFDGEPRTGRLLGSVTVPALGSGDRRVATIQADRADLIGKVSMAIRGLDDVTQCATDNDGVSSSFTEYEVYDLDTPERTDTFSLLYYVFSRLPNPIFSAGPPPNVSIVAGETYSTVLQAIAGGPGDGVYYELPTDAPRGFGINSVTGVLTWTPTFDQVGTYTTRFTARNTRLAAGVTGNTTFAVVPRPNAVPEFVSTPVTSVAFESTYVYNALATDADNDTLIYSLVTAPAGMAIDSSTGVVSWTPTVADAGENAVEILVDDQFGGTATQNFFVEVILPDNEGPTITSDPAFSGRVGVNYEYQVVASDPDSDDLIYSLTTAPAGMTIDANGFLEWLPTVGGAEDVVVRVSDGIAFIEQGWTITVADSGAPFDATLVVTPLNVALGETVSVTLLVENAAGDITFTADVDGTPFAMANNGTGSFVASAVGLQTVSVTVTDATGSLTRAADVTVTDPQNQTDAPVVTITSPTEGQEVTAPTDIIGSVDDDNLAQWTLYLLEENRPTSEIVELATGTDPFGESVISQVDPTLLLNGLYQIFLQAEDFSGNVSTVSRPIRVTGNMKVGNFSITFEDLSLPVAGIPITVSRTYDSRQRNKSQDFGFGWTIDYQNVRVHESRDIGFSWTITPERFGALTQSCVRPNGDPTVTVTLPDGEVETFVARAVPECSFGGQPFVNIVFEPRDFTSTSLRQTTYGLVRIVNDNLVDPGALDEPIDPTTYELTTDEGFVYELDQAFGVRRVTDPHGNTLTYSETGIAHSSGYAIDFVRDAQDRITEIQVPDGTSLIYDYDGNGDLVAFTDQVNQTTTFTYELNQPHYLDEIMDPRMIPVVRNEYDDDGRLISTTDGQGNVILYDHDVVGRTERVTDRRGNVTTYVFDDEGNVLVETDLTLNETITRTYDADRNVLAETNGEGETMTMTYDERGNMLTEENALGEITTYTYDRRNLVETILDPEGNLTTNSYDTRNTNLLSSIDAEGQLTQFVWDSGIGSGCSTGVLREVIDAEGHIRETIPQCFGPFAELPRQEVDQNGVRTFIFYNTGDVWRREREEVNWTDSTGVTQTLVTSYEYDDKGRETLTAYADGSFTRTEYNLIDKVAATIDERGNRTEMEYNERGELELTRYPDLTTETMTYDANGNVVSQTDRLGRTTTMVYDAKNRLVETIYPDATSGDLTDNPGSRMEYDRAGRMIASIDERGNRTEYEYDEAGRLELVRNALNQVTRHEYDRRGLRTATIDDLGRRTVFVYDDVGRLIETIMPDGVTDANGQNLRTTVDYDRIGRKVSETDPAGETTLYAYDPVGNLLRVTDALGQVTSYTYDELNNKVAQTDANNHTTTWGYDERGRPISRTLPDGVRRETMTYDPAGNMDSRIDFNGETTTFVYDNMNRMVRSDHADGRVNSMTYTDTGLIATAVDARGTTAYEFDERDRLVLMTQPDSREIRYSYDDSSNRVSLQTANQFVTYTYDVLNRLETVDDESGVTTYAYDRVGNRESVDHANGTRSAYTYDTLNRLERIVTEGPAPARPLISQHDYVLGDAGNRLELIETLVQPDGSTVSRTTEYDYDALYRLRSETVTTDSTSTFVSWTYDPVGNRLTESVGATSPVVTSYVYDDNDWLQTETTDGVVTSYGYDDNGNTLTRTVGGVQNANYVYDSQDRMTVANITDGGSTVATFYEYDVNGVRQSETRGGITRQYLVDTNRPYAQVIEETDNLVGLRRFYLHGDDLISQSRISGNDVATAQADTYLYDGLGSVRTLTGSTGTVTDTYTYEAFGELEAQNGSTENRYLFTGEQFDPNVGFYYLRARYYNPSIGRFQTMDTFAGRMQEPQTLHKYVYVHSNPINMIDPSGNEGLVAQMAANRIAVSGAIRSGGSSAGRAIGRAVSATYKSGRYVTARLRVELRRCRQSRGQKCRLPNVFVVGAIHREAMEHIGDTIKGTGSNRMLSSPLLTYKPGGNPGSRNWYRNKPECKGNLTRVSGNSCDEWPFFTTVRGGLQGYNRRQVSLRLIKHPHNTLSGSAWGRAVKKLGKDRKMLVVPTGPITFYFVNGHYGI